MYENPEYNERGEKILCEETGKNSHMLMDVRVQKLAAGQKIQILEQEKETAVMLLAGKVVFAFEGRLENAGRRSVFQDKPYCLHCCRGKEISVTAVEDSRVLIQQTKNSGTFDTVFYTPEMCTLQEFGKEQWEGTAHRQVLTVFDYENAPYSNMVMGEVFHKPGCWSSYPPHYHPQPGCTIMNLISPRDLVWALTESSALRWETRAVWRSRPCIPINRRRRRDTGCIMYG